MQSFTDLLATQSDESRRTYSPSSSTLGLSSLNRDYLHLIYRGRLRLGMVRKIDQLLLANILSLGIASWAQSRRLYWELAWHLEGSAIAKQRIWPALIPLPIFNLFSAWRFVKLIAETESQNHYQELKIAKAMLLSLVPPLFIAYLQSHANKHWIAHATEQGARDSADGSVS